MARANRPAQRGLTLLEFTLITLVVAVLVVVAAQRIARIRVAVEKAAVEHSVARMREALAVRFAELVVQGRREQIPRLLGANPMHGQAVPADYVGVRELPPPGAREPGQWYFDESIGNVVYVPRYPDALEWPEGSPGLLRWQVRPDWTDVDGNGRFTPAVDQVRGLGLKRMDEARWR